MDRRCDNLKLAAAIIIPNAGSWINGYITRKNIDNWYNGLKFPAYRPPNWVFAPVWASLYSGMGYGSFLVWKEGGGFNGDAKLPLALYGTQLAMNMAWTPLFFAKHDLKTVSIDFII